MGRLSIVLLLVALLAAVLANVRPGGLDVSLVSDEAVMQVQ